MRFDSLRREPWSTMITPSVSLTQCGFRLIPSLPLLKHSLLDKYLLFEEPLGNSMNLGRVQVRWVLVASLTEDLLPRQGQRMFIAQNKEISKKEKIGIEC
jgi:hypothetical protein